jgi:hypothetical protein
MSIIETRSASLHLSILTIRGARGVVYNETKAGIAGLGQLAEVDLGRLDGPNESRRMDNGNIDERLKNISGQLEVITSMQLETEKRFAETDKRFTEITRIFTEVHASISGLERIARAHEQRISDLEDSQQP